jgi:flavin reductase (DIM6/NTAB) family NADH-FMN oxidoreductase RutF
MMIAGTAFCRMPVWATVPSLGIRRSQKTRCKMRPFSVARYGIFKISQMTAAPITTTDFRHVLGQFATGVTIITVARAPNSPYGMTANAFTSVSLDPLLVLVCVDEKSHLLPLLQKKRLFGVSVLKAHQQPLSVYFAQPNQTAEAEAALGVRYRWTSEDVPLLEDTLAHLVCRVVANYMAGDHTIFLGEVQTAELFAGEPLLFFRSQYRQIAPPR